MRTEKLKERASKKDQIKLLARLAVSLNNDPRNPMDVICHMFSFDSDEHRTFTEEYSRTKSDGDDPLEV